MVYGFGRLNYDKFRASDFFWDEQAKEWINGMEMKEQFGQRFQSATLTTSV
jgi:hypothetical protein